VNPTPACGQHITLAGRNAVHNELGLDHIFMDAIHQAWHQSLDIQALISKQNRNLFYTVSAQ
jgi:hypothetical protein